MWKFDLRTVFFSTNHLFSSWFVCVENSSSNLFSLSKIYFWLAFDRSNGIDCERGQIHIRIFNFIKSCRTSVNIFQILIPHFMKVGGLYFCFKTAWMIVPYVVMNFLEIFFIQTQISWHAEHFKVEFCPNHPKFNFLVAM